MEIEQGVLIQFKRIRMRPKTEPAANVNGSETGSEIYSTYLHRWGTIRTIQNFPISSFSTYIIHCTVFFSMPFPDKKIKSADSSNKTKKMKIQKVFGKIQLSY